MADEHHLLDQQLAMTYLASPPAGFDPATLFDMLNFA
jgi:hypothetical protein